MPMNTIRQIQQLNKRELEQGISTSASWHTDYRDTAYIYIGGLPFEVSEGDIITIFSQFGEPVHINLVRDKETGKSKGFCFLKYEDQRSCDVAVDNLSGAKIMGRLLTVDHTRYQRKDDEEIYDNTYGAKTKEEREAEARRSRESTPERPILKEERELAILLRDHDEEDPMKAYLVEQKQAEVSTALARYEKEQRRSEKHRDRDHRHRHRHHRHRRRESPAIDGNSPDRGKSRDYREKRHGDDKDHSRDTRESKREGRSHRHPDADARDGSSERHKHRSMREERSRRDPRDASRRHTSRHRSRSPR